jgi:enamine deaminase RidA (YjgF/YER057c/UK114 family)
MDDTTMHDHDDAPRALNPAHWPRPAGYSNGMSARGRLVVTGGVVGWDETGRFREGFAAQARQVLENIRDILTAGGASPRHLVRLTWYVTDIDTYLANLRPLGQAYREVIGRHYPAMALVQVVRLVEKDALVEVEAMAVVPDRADAD